MTRVIYILLLIAAVSVMPGCQSGTRDAQEVAPATEEEYRLAVGDVISIRIYGGEEDIAFGRIRLNPSGHVVLPFGDFKAAGQTTQELEAAILASAKGKFLMKPRVWVNVEEYRPYFMQGQVGRPGAYPFQPGTNVRRAINVAGGFRERAAKDKIYILRENDRSTKGSRASLNTPVRPGDTVIVEESFF